MITLLTVAVLWTAPSITAPESGYAGDLVATWVHEDVQRHISISLDADGRCSVVARHQSGGSAHRVACGYWVHGSTVYLRARSELSGVRPILEAGHVRETDELRVRGGDELVFRRRPMQERNE